MIGFSSWDKEDNTGTWIPPNNIVIGTCSLCGGSVIVPYVWHGIIPPVPHCTKCGAHEKRANNFGPVIEMEPFNIEITTTGNV